ncbi:MAG: dehydrogenase [Gemmatales bacterium]|nr:MAG: dehydrogenase [Gemmatales bacterium]
MATTWPKQRRLIGTDIPRIDGADKATGHAKYSYDINRPGMLHAQILRSPHAHAKIKKLDYSKAAKMPGVKAVHVIADVGTELFYAGDEIFALAADTEEHCLDALRAVEIEFEVLPFLVKEEDVYKKDLMTAPPRGKDRKNLLPGSEQTKGDVEQGFQQADAVVEAFYGVNVCTHQCLESHGLVAEWSDNDGRLTVWASTQAVYRTAQALAKEFGIPQENVTCITHHMGGGYGSKFGPDIQGIVCAHLAKKAKRPVKLMLNRADEVTCGGNRPSAFGKVKIGGKKDGTITAYTVDCYGTPGIGASRSVNLAYLPYVYEVENYSRKQDILRLNAGSARAMRAPGHPQNCFLTDSAVDDLAAKLGIDPTIIRRKNLPKSEGQGIDWDAVKNKIYNDEIDIALKLSDWKKKWHPPGKDNGKGVMKYGIGMALHTWGGGAQGNPPNECTVFIHRDGSVTARSSTQDLGTGQRTVTAIVVAEILGLEPREINVKIGESEYGYSTGSGGSTTCPSQAPAALKAATAARDALFAKIAPKLGVKKEDLEIQKGFIVAKNGKKTPWKKACSLIGMDTIKGEGGWSSVLALEEPGLSNRQVGGVQVAEVEVDTETGVVYCKHIVAVQDCGMIVNKLCCESQVAGGVIMGVNYALFEERIMDRQTGRQVNPDMEFYKLGGIQDIPRITVHMYDMPERGVIGIGEPPTISTAAAIGNAIFNAIGVRVPIAPFTPERVLAALAKKGGN